MPGATGARGKLGSFNSATSDPDAKALKHRLRGRWYVACWCAPDPYHGDVLVKALTLADAGR